MLPGITRGTLVVVHKQSDYAVGDVVAYKSALINESSCTGS
jgi:SOS-response transcriptional repressor LexA